MLSTGTAEWTRHVRKTQWLDNNDSGDHMTELSEVKT